MDRVDRDLPLLEKLRRLTPSLTNQICGCAGNTQCACCVIGEAYALLTNPVHNDVINWAVERMKVVDNNDFELPWNDILRCMARAAIETFRGGVK